MITLGGGAQEKLIGLNPRVTGAMFWPPPYLALLGGVLASYIMVFVGLTLSDSGLIYLWPLAILLMFIDARFLCFAYAGGLLALSSIALGWPEVSIPQLLGLVAILHFAEAVLILVSVHLGAMPSLFGMQKARW